jgi:hypothetical protein
MAERKPARLDEHRPVRRAPDDYDAPADEEDFGQEDAEEDDAEYAEDDGALGAASADTQPDVLLDVPTVKVEEIHLEVEDLSAQVSLEAEVLSLLKLHVGADVSLGHVLLDIKGVEAVAQLKVRLDKVEAIIDRVMTTIDNNPQILSDLTRGLGEAAGQIGRGAGEALEEVGAGAGAAVESVGSGLQEAAEDLGRDAGRAVEDVVEDTGVADNARRGREAAGSAAGTEQAGQQPTERAAARGQTARRRPAPPPDRPRPVRQEPPAPASSPRQDQPTRRERPP